MVSPTLFESRMIKGFKPQASRLYAYESRQHMRANQESLHMAGALGEARFEIVARAPSLGPKVLRVFIFRDLANPILCGVTDNPSPMSDSSLVVKMPQSGCAPPITPWREFSTPLPLQTPELHDIPSAEASVKVEDCNRRTAGKSTLGIFTVSRFAGIMPVKR